MAPLACLLLLPWAVAQSTDDDIEISVDWSAAPTFRKVFRVPGDAPTIQAAVGHASDGDVILIQPGTYAEDVVLDGKGLVLAADPKAAAKPKVKSLSVRGSTPTQCTVLSGLEFQTTYSTNGTQGFWNDAGSVRIHDCLFSRTRIDGCADVGVTGSRFDNGLYVRQAATVALHASIVDGFSQSYASCHPADGGDALSLDTRSFLFAVGSKLQGGDGSTSWDTCMSNCDAGYGGAAVYAADIDSYFFGSNVTVKGGKNGHFCWNEDPGSAGTFYGWSWCFGLAPGHASNFVLSKSRVFEGDSVTLAITGAPGDTVELLRSPNTARVGLLNPKDFQWVDAPIGVQPIPGVVPSSGSLIATVSIEHTLPPGSARIEYWQLAVTSVSTPPVTTFGAAATVVIFGN